MTYFHVKTYRNNIFQDTQIIMLSFIDYVSTAMRITSGKLPHHVITQNYKTCIFQSNPFTRSGGSKDYYQLVRDAVYSGRSCLIFRREVLSPFSGLERDSSTQEASVFTACSFQCVTLRNTVFLDVVHRQEL
jgi:hypothetical protein